MATGKSIGTKPRARKSRPNSKSKDFQPEPSPPPRLPEGPEAEEALKLAEERQARKTAAVEQLSREAAEAREARRQRDLAVLLERASRPPAWFDPKEAARRVADEREREREQRVANLVSCAGVPPQYERASLLGDDMGSIPLGCRPAYGMVAVELSAMVDAAHQYAAGRSRGRGPIVALIGPGGEGKTTMLCGAVLDVCRTHALFARYVSFPDLIDELSESERFNAKRSVRQVVAAYCRPALLAIDEVDKSDRGQLRLEQLVTARHAAGSVTLMAGNVTATIDAAAIVLGTRVLSRMQEGGQVLPCRWGDLRGAIAKR